MHVNSQMNSTINRECICIHFMTCFKIWKWQRYHMTASGSVIVFWSIDSSGCTTSGEKMPMGNFTQYTVFENYSKCLVHKCERSELRLQFEWTWINQKCQMVQFGVFLKKTCGQTVLPDRSILIGQNWWKMPKSENSNETFSNNVKMSEKADFSRSSWAFQIE